MLHASPRVHDRQLFNFVERPAKKDVGFEYSARRQHYLLPIVAERKTAFPFKRQLGTKYIIRRGGGRSGLAAGVALDLCRKRPAFESTDWIEVDGWANRRGCECCSYPFRAAMRTIARLHGRAELIAVARHEAGRDDT
jgi:hypothetical protein